MNKIQIETSLCYIFKILQLILNSIKQTFQEQDLSFNNEQYYKQNKETLIF